MLGVGVSSLGFGVQGVRGCGLGFRPPLDCTVEASVVCWAPQAVAVEARLGEVAARGHESVHLMEAGANFNYTQSLQ